MTCPNRDGLIDTKGCIFCSAGGSGDFAGGRKSDMDINTQIDNAKALIKNKYNGILSPISSPLLILMLI